MTDKFKKLEKWFEEYTGRFQSRDTKIQVNFDLKILHTKKVLENAEALCLDLQINAEDIFITRAAALLHDVGRFEQFNKYRTFVDKHSADHAELGLQILDDEAPLAELPDNITNYIRLAIQHHNKLEVPDHLDNQAKFFTRLLRDADKLDIFRVVTEYYEQQKSGHQNEAIVLGLPDNQHYSDHVIEDILNHRIVKSQDLKTINDFKLLQMAWIFDINFVAALNRVHERKYLERIYESLPKDDKINRAYAIINEFVADNCKKDLKARLW
ncbi:MAG: HD domain-containing protein [Candidatus Marinimicrobia bacterium]|nr:HD domain-containing protein [Candidatus Neomarinimicrobiota bacterium]